MSGAFIAAGVDARLVAQVDELVRDGGAVEDQVLADELLELLP